MFCYKPNITLSWWFILSIILICHRELCYRHCFSYLHTLNVLHIMGCGILLPFNTWFSFQTLLFLACFVSNFVYDLFTEPLHLVKTYKNWSDNHFSIKGFFTYLSGIVFILSLNCIWNATSAVLWTRLLVMPTVLLRCHD
jgi:hypothetical protein